MLSEFFSYWVLQSVAMMLTAALIPRLTITGISGAFGTVLALALVNASVWDAALFFNVPDHLSAQAGLLFLANGVLFWILVKILPGIEVEGVLPALIAPVVFTVLSLIISHYGKDIDWPMVGSWLLQTIEQVRDFFLSVKQANAPQT